MEFDAYFDEFEIIWVDIERLIEGFWFTLGVKDFAVAGEGIACEVDVIREDMGDIDELFALHHNM